MYRFTPDGRWTAPPGQFAAKIPVGSLPGVLSKSLFVDADVRAILLEDGEVVGELGPGEHTLETLAERLSFEPRPVADVIMLRAESVLIELPEMAVSTQDGQNVRVALRAQVQIDNLTLFLRNVLGARDCLALGELRAMLMPVLEERLRESVGLLTVDALMQADGKRRLAAAVGETNGGLGTLGFRLATAVEVSIRQAEEARNTADDNPPTFQPSNVATRSGRRTIRASQAGAAVQTVQPPTASMPVFVNSLGMKVAAIPSGSFVMGSPAEEMDRSGMEDQHAIEITQSFYLGVFPVTQDEYRQVMGTDPSCFAQKEMAAPAEPLPGQLPVERVSWEDACEFCRRLSELAVEKVAGRLYRLPTEAEWEYACRAGTTTAFAFGPSLDAGQANFTGPLSAGAARGTTVVGSFPPNAWGLYDMHGNVWEWCNDWFFPDYYGQSPSSDPQGPPSGFARVLRGGGWRSRAAQCRSAARYSATATQRHDAFGFRVACIIRR